MALIKLTGALQIKKNNNDDENSNRGFHSSIIISKKFKDFRTPYIRKSN